MCNLCENVDAKLETAIQLKGGKIAGVSYVDADYDVLAIAPTAQAIRRRAARLGIQPRDLDDAVQHVYERLLIERPSPDVVNVMIRRRLISYAAKEYGRRAPDGKRGRGTAYRSAYGNRNNADINARHDDGIAKYEHVNATPDTADQSAARVDLAAIIQRADARLSNRMYHVLTMDARGFASNTQAALLLCSESTIQNVRNAAYAILRSVA